MVLETRKQSMAWMEHGLNISLKRYTLSMEDKLWGALLIMDETAPVHLLTPPPPRPLVDVDCSVTLQHQTQQLGQSLSLYHVLSL